MLYDLTGPCLYNWEGPAHEKSTLRGAVHEFVRGRRTLAAYAQDLKDIKELCARESDRRCLDVALTSYHLCPLASSN